MNIVNYMRNILVDFSSLIKIVSLFSLGFFILTLLIMPAVLVLMPCDILVRERKHPGSMNLLGQIGYIIYFVIKNAFGILLFLLGIALLFLPGQGLLTIFAGALLLDFPRKRLILSRLLGYPQVKTPLEKLRKRFNRLPLIYPHDDRYKQEY